MKKIILAVLILVANMSLMACTEERLADAQDENNTEFMGNADDVVIDPPADPPGDDN